MAHCLRHHTRGSASSEYLLSALLVGLMGVAGFTAFGTGMGKGIAGDGDQGTGQSVRNGGAMAVSTQAGEEGDGTSGSGTTPAGGSLTATRAPLYIPDTAATSGAAGEATDGTSGTAASGEEGGTRSAGDLASQDAEMFPEPKGEGTAGYGSLAKRLFMLTPIPWLHATFTGNEEKKKEYGDMLGSFGTEIRNFPVLMGDLAGMVSTWMRHGDWGALGKMASMFAPQTFAKMIAHDYKSLVRGDMQQAGRGGLYTLINFQWFGGAQLTGEFFRGAKVVGEAGELTRGASGLSQAMTKFKGTRVGSAVTSAAEKARASAAARIPESVSSRAESFRATVRARVPKLSARFDARRASRVGTSEVDTARARFDAARAAVKDAQAAGASEDEIAKLQDAVNTALTDLSAAETRYASMQPKDTTASNPTAE